MGVERGPPSNSLPTPLLQDPCRLARPVNQFEWLEDRSEYQTDPCRLARRVNQFERLRRLAAYAQPTKLIHL